VCVCVCVKLVFHLEPGVVRPCSLIAALSHRVARLAASVRSCLIVFCTEVCDTLDVRCLSIANINVFADYVELFVFERDSYI
jgi:hypothetical protein